MGDVLWSLTFPRWWFRPDPMVKILWLRCRKWADSTIVLCQGKALGVELLVACECLRWFKERRNMLYNLKGLYSRTIFLCSDENISTLQELMQDVENASGTKLTSACAWFIWVWKLSGIAWAGGGCLGPTWIRLDIVFTGLSDVIVACHHVHFQEYFKLAT